MPHAPAPQWIGDDVTVCLTGAHVHMFLDCIVEYWNSSFGLRHWSVPKQIQDSDVEGHGRFVQRVKTASRIERIRQLAGIHGTKRFSGVLTVDDFVTLNDARGAGPERSMFLAVIRRAVAEFAKGVVSPLESEQREALNAYWWIMGYGWLLPDGADPYRVEARVHRLAEADDPFRVFNLSPSALVHVHPEGVYPKYTGGLSSSALRYLQLSSLVSVAHAVDVDYMAIRRRLPIVPPPDEKTLSVDEVGYPRAHQPRVVSSSEAAFLDSIESKVALPIETYNGYQAIY